MSARIRERRTASPSSLLSLAKREVGTYMGAVDANPGAAFGRLCFGECRMLPQSTIVDSSHSVAAVSGIVEWHCELFAR